MSHLNEAQQAVIRKASNGDGMIAHEPGAGKTGHRIEQRMLSGEPFTFGGLCVTFGRDHSRLIDRTIQKLRKRGRIAFRRDGRDVIWSAVAKPAA